ncbi:MAG: hypothetical protein ACUVSX_12450 [Aggregatilineales bacterium]
MAAPQLERVKRMPDTGPEPVSLTLPYVQTLLKEVKLVVTHTAPPVGHTGEFWCRRLTDYGRDVMRALVRASAPAFAYPETFVEPPDADVPALALLAVADAQISGLRRAGIPLDAAALSAHPYLRERGVAVSAARLADALAALDGGCYDDSGHKDPAALRRAIIARWGSAAQQRPQPRHSG